MKRFEDILGYSQSKLKDYLCNYLCGVGYKVEKGDGFVFAKGSVPVLLIAHMDTSNGVIPSTIIKTEFQNGYQLSADGTLIGGDDRCGVWMIMNIIKKVKAHVLFLEDEEIGCVGARKFTKTDYVKYVSENISFMIELDRRGSNDCVFYSNDNRGFVKYIEEKTGTKEAIGSMSDISVIMPETNVAGVNLSCGYYKEHTASEYIVVSEMESIMNRVIDFMTKETEFPKYKYVRKQYLSWGNYSSFNDDEWWKKNYSKSQSYTQKRAMRSLNELTLCVEIDPDYWGDELSEIEVTGKSPTECWAKLFIENEYISFEMISDYYFQ